MKHQCFIWNYTARVHLKQKSNIYVSLLLPFLLVGSDKPRFNLPRPKCFIFVLFRCSELLAAITSLVNRERSLQAQILEAPTWDAHYFSVNLLRESLIGCSRMNYSYMNYAFDIPNIWIRRKRNVEKELQIDFMKIACFLSRTVYYSGKEIFDKNQEIFEYMFSD